MLPSPRAKVSIEAEITPKCDATKANPKRLALSTFSYMLRITEKDGAARNVS